MSDTIPAHYLTVSLLCEYQKWSGRGITIFEEGQKIVSDLWNALHVCTSKKAAVLYLKNDCGWNIPNHQLLAFTSSIWMYKAHIAKHELQASLRMAVNAF